MYCCRRRFYAMIVTLWCAAPATAEGDAYGFLQDHGSSSWNCGGTVRVLLEQQALVDDAHTGDLVSVRCAVDFGAELSHRSLHLLVFLGRQHVAGAEAILDSLEEDRACHRQLPGACSPDGDLRRADTAIWPDGSSFFRLPENQEAAGGVAAPPPLVQ